MNKETIVFIRPSDSISPRLFKLTNICKRVYEKVIFLGAKRSKQEVNTDFKDIEFKKVGIYYPFGSIKYLIGTVFFVLAALRELLKSNPGTIHASDLEGAIPGFIYKFVFRKTYLIINVHDNFFARYKVNKQIKKILKAVEYFFYSNADMLLFPDQNRIEIFKPYTFKNTWCIPNTPDDPGYEKPPSIDGKVKLFIAGFISEVRGLNQFIELANKHEDIELHFVGRCSDTDMEKIKNCKRAIYYGRKSQIETLSIGHTCHVLPIFYEPNKEIHVYASPNKLFDAFALGRPVIMNSGLKVNSFVKDYDMGEIVDYYNVDELYNALRRIVDNYEAFCQRSENIRKAYVDFFLWKNYERDLTKFFNEIKQ